MSKISMIMAVLLVTVSLVFDGIQFLVDWLDLTGVGIIVDIIVNNAINIITVLTFYIWLKMLNVSFVDPKRALRFFGAYGVKLLPLVNALPAVTTGIVLTIASVWAEERMQIMRGLNTALNARLAAGSQKIPGRGGVGPNATRTTGGSVDDISKSIRDYREFKNRQQLQRKEYVGDISQPINFEERRRQMQRDNQDTETRRAA